MAGILNNTARQFNLKTCTKDGHRATVRVAPGFNVVNDDHWQHFKGNEYVAELKEKGKIDFGDHIDDLELERDADTVSKSKVVPTPKSGKDALKSAQADIDKMVKEATDKLASDIKEAKDVAKAEAKEAKDEVKAEAKQAKAEAKEAKDEAKAEAKKIVDEAKAEAKKIKADAEK